jgi:dephospho-CoA kinase
VIHAESVKAWEAESNDLRKIIGEQRREMEQMKSIILQADAALHQLDTPFSKCVQDAANILGQVGEFRKANEAQVEQLAQAYEENAKLRAVLEKTEDELFYGNNYSKILDWIHEVGIGVDKERNE